MATIDANTINIRKLQSLYSSSHANKTAFDHWAAREKNSTETKVERLQELLRQSGVDASRRDVVELFKELELAHCGQFYVGRRGHSSRFVWSVSLIDVGQAAAGETTTVESLSESEKQGAETEEMAPEFIEHLFNLRPGERITMSLPRDLTKTEAFRLAEFIKTLPFDG